MQLSCMSSQTFDWDLNRFDRGVATIIAFLADLSGFHEAGSLPARFQCRNLM
jgi:hypothetical protein